MQFADQPADDYSGRLDWNMNLSNTINARYQNSKQTFENNELIIGEQTYQHNDQSNLGVTWTGIISSETVQEARFGLGLRSTNVDILAGNDTPVVRFGGITPSSIIGNAGAFPINRDQRDEQLVYNLSTSRWASHTLKVGADIRRSRLDDRAQNFNRGFWNIGASCGGVSYPNGYAAFMAGCVSTFQKAYGPDLLQNELNEQNVYAQDDWRLFDNLVFNLGVRYERVEVPKEVDDRIDYFYDTTQYVDPRLGFAYTPNWDNNRFLRAFTGGNGRFSIRGGYGHYHGRVFQSVFSQSGANVRYNPPNATFLSIGNSTNISDPTNGFVLVPGQPLTQRVSLTLVDPELVMPETRQWNLTFERQFFQQSRFRASYIGTVGKNLLQYRYNNLPVRPDGTTWKVAADWRCAGTGGAGVPTNATCPTAVPIAPNELSLRVPRTNERRPDARYTTNLMVANDAESTYHAGQVEWETGLVRGLQGRVTYTFAKALDTGSEATSSGTGDLNFFPPESNKDYKRGLSRFDTRHRITMTGSYDIPFLRNREDWIGAVLGGWQIASVVKLASGTPFTIIDGGAVDIDFDGAPNARPVCVREEYCGGWHVNFPGNSVSEMPRDAFRRAQYGDKLEDLVGRNTYFTDGSETVDVALSKSFGIPAAIGESILVRLDVFNVFNKVTWGFPNNDWNSTAFGTITSTGYAPRTYQLGFRFIY